jgi:RHS repeat-associated protein
MAVVDPTSQTVKTGYGYSPFGTTFKSNNNSNNNLLFTGRELDLGGTVYYFRGRYYNAGFQRFLSEDPIGFAGGDTNLYRYGGNNPLIGNDPTGLAFDLSVSSGSPGNSGISISSDPGGFFDFFNYVPGGQPIPNYNMPASSTATGSGNHGVPVLINNSEGGSFSGGSKVFDLNVNNGQYRGVRITRYNTGSQVAQIPLPLPGLRPFDPFNVRRPFDDPFNLRKLENSQQGRRYRCTLVYQSPGGTCGYNCKGYGAIATFPLPPELNSCPEGFDGLFPGP